jgi:hypothetical protein
VRYEAVNAMLLNEFLKEHRKVEQLESTVARQRNDFEQTMSKQRSDLEEKMTEQRKEIALLKETLKLQASEIEKVSEQLAVQKPGGSLIATVK